MPKVNSYMTHREAEARTKVATLMALKRLNRKQLAKLIGIPYTTLNDRIRDIGGMRLNEYWAVLDELEKAERAIGSK